MGSVARAAEQVKVGSQRCSVTQRFGRHCTSNARLTHHATSRGHIPLPQPVIPTSRLQAQALARGRLSRSTTHEPLEVLLLSARTLVLPPLQPAAAPQQQQPSELQAGGSGGDGADAAAVASAEGEQSGEGAAAEAAATGEEAVAAGGEEEQQPGVSNARAAELAQAADLLKRARRMVAAPAAGAAGEGASAPAAAAAAPDLRPVLLEGDLAWAKSLFVGGREAGSEGAGDWEAEREAKTTARAKYQVILEALASAPPGAAEGAGEGAAAAADASSPAREAGSGPAPAGAAGAGASAQAALGAWEWLLLRAYLRLGESYLSDDSDPGSGESVFAGGLLPMPLLHHQLTCCQALRPPIRPFPCLHSAVSFSPDSRSCPLTSCLPSCPHSLCTQLLRRAGPAAQQPGQVWPAAAPPGPGALTHPGLQVRTLVSPPLLLALAASGSLLLALR